MRRIHELIETAAKAATAATAATGRRWEDASAEERAAARRQVEPAIRAALAMISAMPKDEAGELLRANRPTQPVIGPVPFYVVQDEPRTRRRLWPVEKRVRCAAREALSGEGARPNPFVVALRTGEAYLVGHRTGIVTSVVSYVASCISTYRTGSAT